MPNSTNTALNRKSAATSPASVLQYGSTVWRSRPVAFLATTRHEGGLERLSLKLAAELSRRGADIRYICRPGSPLSHACRNADVAETPLVVRNSADFAAASKLARYLVSQNIGMLHVHSRRDFVSAVIAVKLAARQMARRPRLILHVHQVRRLGDGGFLADMFFNWGADKVLAVSGAVKSKLVGGSILQRRLVDVLMNGVNESEYQIPGSAQAYEWRKEMRSKWGLTPTGPVIGMVGRLDQKGQLFVVSCLPEILKRAPDTQIVLIGPPGKRGTIDDLKSAAMAGGCIDRVIFAGEVKNMPAAYAAMDLLVHLPTDEAFGLAIAEAMASSIPVVAGEVGGCVELVRHNETGLLIEPRDKGQLVDAIGRIFDQSGDLFRSEFGIAARKRIESCFTFDRQVDNLEEIYDRLSLTGS